jgi:hypothetical protein
MKSTLLFLTTGVLVAGLAAFGQNGNPPDPQTRGQGRGGAPNAWGDRNGDGICDFTGNPVGQCQGTCPGFRGGQGQGMGRGMGRGTYCPRVQTGQPQADSGKSDARP